jgi:hypothetical protein
MAAQSGRSYQWERLIPLLPVAQYLAVMAGLVPAIHALETAAGGYIYGVDARHKAGHDAAQNLVVPDQWG